MIFLWKCGVMWCGGVIWYCGGSCVMSGMVEGGSEAFYSGVM